MSRSTLAARVYDALKGSLLDGSFWPGEPLTIESIADELGTSITPVRHALSQLSAEGLVAWEPNKQPIAAFLTEEDVRHLYAVRLMLDPFFSLLLAEKAEAGTNTRAELEHVKADLVLSLAHPQDAPADRPWRVVKWHYHIYSLLLDDLPSGFLSRQLRLLSNYVLLLRLTNPDTSAEEAGQRFRTVCREHLAITNAILRGDPGEIQAATSMHLKHSETNSLEALKKAK